MSTTPKPNSWVTCPKPNPQASLRLFCFPYAGGSSSTFRTWSDSLPKNIEVCSIEYPGRGTQMRSVPFTRLEPLVSAIAQGLTGQSAAVLLPYLDKPFAFFGHSMGGLICFEVARLLRRNYKKNPVHLFISGRSAPQIAARKPPIHTLPEPKFLEEIRLLNGTPEAILENTELMQLLVPILRADFSVLETYEYVPAPPLECAIAAFGGLQDQEVNIRELEAWHEQTTISFELQMFSGDHFFLHSAQHLLLHSIAQKLKMYLLL
jgi:medium-chain acyl-[acyl-carrier-protein] hydrolase